MGASVVSKASITEFVGAGVTMLSWFPVVFSPSDFDVLLDFGELIGEGDSEALPVSNAKSDSFSPDFSFLSPLSDLLLDLEGAGEVGGTLAGLSNARRLKVGAGELNEAFLLELLLLDRDRSPGRTVGTGLNVFGTSKLSVEADTDGGGVSPPSFDDFLASALKLLVSPLTNAFM